LIALLMELIHTAMKLLLPSQAIQEPQLAKMIILQSGSDLDST